MAGVFQVLGEINNLGANLLWIAPFAHPGSAMENPINPMGGSFEALVGFEVTCENFHAQSFEEGSVAICTGQGPNAFATTNQLFCHMAAQQARGPGYEANSTQSDDPCTA